MQHTEQTIDELIKSLQYEYQIPNNVIDMYNQHHRFYHNKEHIYDMISKAYEKYGNVSVKLLMAILFHDIVYDPQSSTNEEDSANLMWQYYQDQEVYDAIIDTKTHNPRSELSKELCELDLDILNRPITDLIEFEKKICKEYQFVDYEIYKSKRIEVLQSLNVNTKLIEYVENRELSIAVYPGSFNPFHIGHYDILTKAERIFDKVIISVGNNPSKTNDKPDLPNRVQNRQIKYYDGLLTDYVNSFDYKVTIVRGIRNSTDLDYENNQYRFLKDIDNNIDVIYIPSDEKYNHISSSAIRQLDNYGIGNKYRIL